LNQRAFGINEIGSCQYESLGRNKPMLDANFLIRQERNKIGFDEKGCRDADLNIATTICADSNKRANEVSPHDQTKTSFPLKSTN
jgi:hypothetical protein